MFALAVLIVVLILFGVGIWGRRRCGLAVTGAYCTDLAILVAGTATALVTMGAPTYVIVRRAIYGGSIGDNLPAGVSEDGLLSLVIIGGGIMVVAAVVRYVQHIRRP